MATSISANATARLGRSDDRATRSGSRGAAEIAPALQNLRMIATLLVLLAHAAIAYVETPLRTTLWSAYDGQSSRAFDVLAYWVNGFAMPLFFLIAGISAPAACAARGAGTFVKHRARRLLIPFAFSLVTILPLSYLAYGLGLVSTEQITMNDILRLKFKPLVQQQRWGPIHLWFLEYLFLVCVGWAALRTAGIRLLPTRVQQGWRRIGEWVLVSPCKPLLAAIPTSLILAWDADAFLRLSNSFLPDLLRIAHYLTFFVVGAWIGAAPDPRTLLERRAGSYGVASLALFALLFPLIIDHMQTPLDQPLRTVLAGGAALFTWLTLFALAGVCCRWLNRQGAALRYLSEASFWIYLIHLPIVALCQWRLLDFALPSGVKFAAVASVAVGVSLVSYELVVRYSLVGQSINGARKRSAWPNRWIPELGWIGIVAFSLVVFSGCLWQLRAFVWEGGFAEVIPGVAYRSARLSLGQLERQIAARGIRTVLSVAGHETEASLAAQRELCQARGVEFLWMDLAPETPPRPDQIVELTALLADCPRPVLIEGHRGLGRAGFGSATALLLEGRSPDEALDQFGWRFGQLGGPRSSVFARLIAEYGEFLMTTAGNSSRERFLAWTKHEYPAARAVMLAQRSGRSAVAPPASAVQRLELARRGGREPR